MTPEAWNALASAVKDYGLPLVMLGLFAWAILRRKLVTGGELAVMTALFERERADRIAAEAIVAKFANANADVAEAVAELSTTVLGAKPRPRRGVYDERLEGTTRAG